MTDIVVRLRFWGDSYHLHKESADEIEKLRAEIERLRAGGCARDQTTTQYCAEAVALQSENARLKDAIHDLAKHISRWDWWSLKPETHALVGEKE